VPLSTQSREALHVVRSTRAARRFTDALPVGNGVRGAMCAGHHGGERLWLNDITAWSGAPGTDPLRGALDGGREALAAIRDALARGDAARAERLMQRQQAPWVQAYLPLGWIDITLLDDETDADATGDDGCRRRLDLHAGYASCSYATAGGVRVQHETWADIPTAAIVHRVTASAPVRLSIGVDSLLRPAHPSRLVDRDLVAELMLPVDVAPGHEHPPEPVRYDDAGRTAAVVVRSAEPLHFDGQRFTTAWAARHTFVIGTATSPPLPGDPGGGIDAVAGARAIVDSAAAHLDPARADVARAAHTAAHEELSGRCELELPSPADAVDIDTDARVARAEERDDPGLAALVFHYGRYLLAAASRGTGLPMTLQGLWNAELPGPWSCAYTTNINLQMAYWPAETTGLPECHEPLLRFVERVSQTTGRDVARRLHAADGWVAHHNSDAWGAVAPVGDGHGDPAWAFWPLGGVWLALHLWDHYAFGGDLRFLRDRAWPVLLETARFALSWIQTDGDTAWTSPSTSPENHYLDAGGDPRGVGVTATMDVALLRELADVCRRAGVELDRDDPEIAALTRVTALLPDPAVSPAGTLEEWNPARTDAEPGHRHLSHLVGLHPYAQITPAGTPELAAAAARTITGRGLESSGWALAWRAAMWARLGDATRFAQHIRMSLRSAEGAVGAHRGGLYANLFSAHPPFQIDGNLGVTAAIAEALVQSHEGFIRVLPALPAAWPDGAVSGIRARGGIVIDVEWSGGRARRVGLRSDSATTMEVALPGELRRHVRLEPGRPVLIDCDAHADAAAPTYLKEPAW
jgi:alpha-L-fucosidase 2